MNNNYYKNILINVFKESVKACHPSYFMHKYVPKKRPKGNVFLVGAGKGSAEMAKYFEIAWEKKRYGPLKGLIITRYGHACKCKNIEVVEAAHPIPDINGVKTTDRIVKIAKEMKKNDLLIFLISGGASSLLVNPIDGLTLKEKQKINSLLLKSGATISEINAVRKHLSLVKGGKLIKYAYPAKVLTLAISDVPGDDLGVIGSGPTYPDDSTRNDALKVLNKYNIKFSNKIKSILNNSNNETPNFKDKVFKNSNIKLIAKPQDALNKAAKTLASYGFKSMVLSDSIEGESEDIGIAHGAIAKQVIKYNQPKRPPLCILSGGETTVTVNNANGKGGRNTQFLLSLAIYLNSIKDIYAIACDTDGIDGSEENAGAIIYPNTLKRANKLGLNANKFLKNNDAYTFFQKLGDLVVTGPTNTNVNDFRAIIII